MSFKLKLINFNWLGIHTMYTPNWLGTHKVTSNYFFSKLQVTTFFLKSYYFFRMLGGDTGTPKWLFLHPCFFDCDWRSHLLSPTTSTSWNENERSEWLWSESEVKWSEVKVKWSEVNDDDDDTFWSFIFPETYIYYRSCIYLKRY